MIESGFNMLDSNELSSSRFININSSYTVRKLLIPVIPVSTERNNDEVFRRFEQDPELFVIPVVDNDRKPVGLISRYTLIDRFARPFRRELFGKKSCTLCMDGNPIIVDVNTSINDISRRLSQSLIHHMLDGFIITEHGSYVGVGSSQSVMAIITDMQINAARYANPLTQLPGNVPINEHIEKLLSAGNAFMACYCDLDHFKPYNDVYGYHQGDDLIKFLCGILIEICDPQRDFVGHIGGDDFMLIMQSRDWEQRLNNGLAMFDAGVTRFLQDAHVQAGGYYSEDRRGIQFFHPLPSLSIGCLDVNPLVFSSHHHVSASATNAKKQAKKIQGSSLFIERRNFGNKNANPA